MSGAGVVFLRGAARRSPGRSSRLLRPIWAAGAGVLGVMSLTAGVSPQSERLAVPPEGRPGFTRLPAQATGIPFTNELSAKRAATNRHLLSGSGVAAGDVDGDGWCDLYFCGLDGPNVLYRNLGGWKFEEITAKAGVAGAGWDSTGAVLADVDGDRDLDLLVNTLGEGTHLFLNDGQGVFTEATAAAGLRSRAGSTSMALADLEGDGDLDLYVTHFRPNTVRDRPATRFDIEYVQGRPVVARVDGVPVTAPSLTNRFEVAPSGEVLELGEEDALYENDGTGRFTRLSFTGGRFLDERGEPLETAPRDWGLAAQFHDFNGDHAPDLYVCNDYWTPDRAWVNDGRGRFRAVATLALRSICRSSMGVDFADIDRDGDADFVVVDMFSPVHARRQIQVAEVIPYRHAPGEIETRPQLSQNTLQLNRGDGTFAEVAQFAGLEASEWSWCPVFLDVDLDGWDDLLVSNGHRRDFQNADAAARIQRALAARELSLANPERIMELFPPIETPKAAFRNQGGLTFVDAAAEWGFNSSDISHGLCLADLDNDGDLDVVMNNLGTPATLYRNDCAAPRIAIRLAGAAGNTQGIGAKITVRSALGMQSKEMIAGGRYLSGDAAERVFAAPPGQPLEVEVRWRGGRVSRFSAESNHRYTVSEPP